jgi:hypothetical protein
MMEPKKKLGSAENPAEVEASPEQLDLRLIEDGVLAVRGMLIEVPEKPTPATSLEQAKEVMGENFFGPKDASDQMPSLPFSVDDLERAKELDQLLIYRASTGPHGQALTMQNLPRLVRGSVPGSQENLLYDESLDQPVGRRKEPWYSEEQFFTGDSPRTGWVLQSRGLIPNSTDKNDLEQTQALATYLEQVFAGREMPAIFQAAIAEFDQEKNKIRELLDSSIVAFCDMAITRLSSLQLNQLLRRSPVEAFNDLLLVWQNTGIRLMEKVFERTNVPTSNGRRVAVGGFGGWIPNSGVVVGEWDSIAPGPDHGVSFCRYQ